MLKATVRLAQGMQFVGVSGTGHGLVMDADAEFGGENSGPRPTELLLLGFGGCTGMDVISILRKKRQRVTGLEIRLDGAKSGEHPKRLTEIRLTYVVSGYGLKKEAVERAITLSQEKYCSVGNTLGRSARIAWDYEIVESGEPASGA